MTSRYYVSYRKNGKTEQIQVLADGAKQAGAWIAHIKDIPIDQIVKSRSCDMSEVWVPHKE